jgi:hypothetical protein
MGLPQSRKGRGGAQSFSDNLKPCLVAQNTEGLLEQDPLQAGGTAKSAMKAA